MKLPEVIGFVKTKHGGASSGRRAVRSSYILQLVLGVQSDCLWLYPLFAQTNASSHGFLSFLALFASMICKHLSNL